jgi:hypothetical protein
MIVSRKTVAGTAAVGMLVLGEAALRRSRPLTRHGRYANWIHPGGRLAGALTGLGNLRLPRKAFEFVPVFAYRSDIRAVVYVNYLVPAARVAQIVPPGLRLQRVGPGEDQAVFTFLSYRHGNLGPAFLGPARSLLPSPVQTNWRVYVMDPRSGCRGVYFVTTAVDRIDYALGARWMCEGLPAHLLTSASVVARADGAVHLSLRPGGGSAPDAEAQLRPVDEPSDGPWRTGFATYRDMLEHVVPQDRALSVQPWHHRVTRQEITLDSSVADCQPLAGSVHSRAARAFVGDAEPFSFLLPQVRFRFDREVYDRYR